MFESIPTYPNPGIGVRPHVQYMHVVFPTCMYIHTRSMIEGIIITYCARYTVHLEYLSLVIMVHTSKSFFPSLHPPSSSPLSHSPPLSRLGRYWEMVQRQKITHFYTAPTALRLLLKAGDEWVHKYDRSSLRMLGCGMYIIIPGYD